MLRVTLRSVLGLLVAGLPALAAQEPDRIRFKQIARVQPNGDVQIENEIAYSPLIYANIRKNVGNPKVLLQDLGLAGEAFEVVRPKIQHDEAKSTIRITATIQGQTRNRGRDWFVECDDADKFEVIDSEPESLTLLVVDEPAPNVVRVGTSRIEFPPGTANIRFDAGRNGLWFQLPTPSSQPQGNVDLDVQIDVRPEIMSCLYKLFGNPRFRILWVARALCRNRGTATVQDLRVRFRIPEYAEWTGWQRSPFVYPGQTVVEAFYPTMSHRIRELRSATPATVEAEWSYHTPDGRKVEDNASRPLAILGLNETLFSNLPADECTTWGEGMNNIPLIAATFVSHTDPIIQQFAGMAAKLAGGAGAAMNPASARRVMQAVYELMAANQIRCQTPPWLFQRGARQLVQFGRDVLRTRTGTCIDLAILYASTCQSAGLEPVIVFMPGHALPLMKLPGGGLQAVETTCVTGTPDGQPIPFEAACRRGEQKVAQALADGQFHAVDIQKLRILGVQPPELPELPPSTPNDWRIKVPDALRPAEPLKASGTMKTIADADGAYTLAIPADWVEQVQGAVHGACDPLDRAGLTVQALPKQAASLDQYVQAMVAGWKQSVPEWKETQRANLTVSGRPAVMIEATGKPGGNEMAAQYYLVLTDRHQLLLVFMCRTGDLAQCRGIFKELLANWRIP